MNKFAPRSIQKEELYIGQKIAPAAIITKDKATWVPGATLTRTFVAFA